MPLFSIITICKNEKNHIKATIDSVLQQDKELFEYIVIDGNSTDGTVEILKEYNNRIVWISEEDKGISEAFNKGIKIAKGDYLFFLNAGDVFTDKKVLKKVSDKLIILDCEILTFNISVKNHGLWAKKPEDLKNAWKTSMIPHQGTFIHKSVFEKIGLYNEYYRIRMDYDFFKRCFYKGFKYDYSMDVIAILRPWGISANNRYLFNKEGLSIRLLYDENVYEQDAISLMTLIKKDEKNTELNMIEIFKQYSFDLANCVIFGAGNAGKKLYEEICKIDSDIDIHFCDNNIQTACIGTGEIMIESPDNAVRKYSDNYFIVSVQDKSIAKEIMEWLIGRKIAISKILFYDMSNNYVYR